MTCLIKVEELKSSHIEKKGSETLELKTLKEFNSLFSGNNLKILKILAKNSHNSVQDIVDNTGLKQSNVSRALNKLRKYGVVQLEKNGKLTQPILIDTSFNLNFSLSTKKTPTKPRVVSLFSGCGGLDLGFEKAGFEIVFANDIEKSVKETYEFNLGDILIKDISLVDKKNDIPNNIDVVLAGIPCQPFSNAGNRGAMSDDRGSLFLQVLEVIKTKTPKIVLFENVKGFLSSKDDTGISMPARIEQELDVYGYKTFYKLLNASDYEVPQNRERVIIIGVRKDQSADFAFPEPITDKNQLTVGSVINKPFPSSEPEEVWKLSPQALQVIDYIPAGGSWKNIPYEKLPERLKRIRDDMKKYRSPNFYRRFNVDEIVGTITAAATPENSGILHPLLPRRYSVREIARFQSFPDDFKFLGDSIPKKYKMIGNAVPPMLAYHIATSLKDQYFT